MTNLGFVDPIVRGANRQPTKLNYTQRIGFKNVCTVSLKRNKEMKRIPYHVWSLRSVLKDPSIPRFPYNPQQRETCDPPKSLASNRVFKTLERDHHHITNTGWLNPFHPHL